MMKRLLALGLTLASLVAVSPSVQACGRHHCCTPSVSCGGGCGGCGGCCLRMGWPNLHPIKNSSVSLIECQDLISLSRSEFALLRLRPGFKVQMTSFVGVTNDVVPPSRVDSRGDEADHDRASAGFLAGPSPSSAHGRTDLARRSVHGGLAGEERGYCGC